jgi:hypothetical protein
VVTFEVTAGETSEALAALPRSAVEINDWGAGAATGDPVPEADIVDDGVMFTGLKTPADLLSLRLRKARCAHWEQHRQKDEPEQPHRTPPSVGRRDIHSAGVDVSHIS